VGFISTHLEVDIVLVSHIIETLFIKYPGYQWDDTIIPRLSTLAYL